MSNCVLKKVRANLERDRLNRYSCYPLLLKSPWRIYNGLITQASLVAQKVKRPPCNVEDRVQSLGWEDPLEKKMATHSSTLAWKIPWMEGPGKLQSTGSQRVWHNWATSLSLFFNNSADRKYWKKWDIKHKLSLTGPSTMSPSLCCTKLHKNPLCQRLLDAPQFLFLLSFLSKSKSGIWVFWQGPFEKKKDLFVLSFLLTGMQAYRLELEQPSRTTRFTWPTKGMLWWKLWLLTPLSATTAQDQVTCYQWNNAD